MSTERIRNQSLDFYKGIAIILVVIGHTLQYRLYPDNFDAIWGFKFIYSFHMPLFIFLSGAIASQWANIFFEKIPFRIKIKIYGDRLKKSATRLLVPFVSWTIVKYIALNMDTGLLKYLIKVFMTPDNSLWFLLVLFYCVVIFSTLCLIVGFISGHQYAAKINQKISFICSNTMTTNLCFALLLWLLIKNSLPNFLGLYMAKMYLFYFIFGAIVFRFIERDLFGQHSSKILRLIPYIIFISLLPAWDRINSNNYNGLYELNFLSYFFPIVIAVAGSLMVLDLSNALMKRTPSIFVSAVAYLGKMSLGIYALHIYFLFTPPMIFAPIIISLLISYISLRIPGLNFLLLGESRGIK